MKKIIKLGKDSGCTPCTNVDSYLELAGNDTEVVRINPFEDGEAMDKYGITSIPVTILVDSEDKEVYRTLGYKPEELDELLALAK